jgi:hypothetical protein
VATVVPIEELVRELVALIMDKCPDKRVQARMIGEMENWLLKGSLADASKAVEDLTNYARTYCIDPTDIVRLVNAILERRLDDKVLEILRG